MCMRVASGCGAACAAMSRTTSLSMTRLEAKQVLLAHVRTLVCPECQFTEVCRLGWDAELRKRRSEGLFYRTWLCPVCGHRWEVRPE